MLLRCRSVTKGIDSGASASACRAAIGGGVPDSVEAPDVAPDSVVPPTCVCWAGGIVPAVIAGAAVPAVIAGGAPGGVGAL